MTVQHRKHEMYHKFRQKIRGLLENIPSSEYPKIIEEIDALARAIEADPDAYEPMHCTHSDKHNHPHIPQRRQGHPIEIRQSKQRIKDAAKLMFFKSAIAWMALIYMTWFCEDVLWWF